MTQPPDPGQHGRDAEREHRPHEAGATAQPVGFDFGQRPVDPTSYGAGGSPALSPPRWSGRKTAIAAALAIGVASVGAVGVAAALPRGSGAESGGQVGGPGFGPRGGFVPGQAPGGGAGSGQGLPNGAVPRGDREGDHHRLGGQGFPDRDGDHQFPGGAGGSGGVGPNSGQTPLQPPNGWTGSGGQSGTGGSSTGTTSAETT